MNLPDHMNFVQFNRELLTSGMGLKEMVLCEIIHFRERNEELGCLDSNQQLARYLDTSLGAIRTMLSKLRKTSYLIETNLDGKRELRVSYSTKIRQNRVLARANGVLARANTPNIHKEEKEYPPKSPKGDSGDSLLPDAKKKSESSEARVAKRIEEVVARKRGIRRQESFQLKASTAWVRKIMDAIGKKPTFRLVNLWAASGDDQFCPLVTSAKSFYDKLPKLIDWYERQKGEPLTAPIQEEAKQEKPRRKMSMEEFQRMQEGNPYA